jgi:hypothetical protein
MYLTTDRDLVLMNAITEIFPEITNFLCMRHINKNILANLKKCLGTEDERGEFTKQ